MESTTVSMNTLVVEIKKIQLMYGNLKDQIEKTNFAVVEIQKGQSTSNQTCQQWETDFDEDVGDNLGMFTTRRAH